MQSVINSKKTYDNDTWVVSVLNTGSRLAGHSVIVVEGIKPCASATAPLFVGQYDIKFMPREDSRLQGEICRVDIFEGVTSTRKYSGYTSKSYYVTRENALLMIQSIKADKAQFEAAYAAGNGVPYHLFGDSSVNRGHGDNCASWAAKKLRVAGINPSSVPKPQILARGGFI